MCMFKAQRCPLTCHRTFTDSCRCSRWPASTVQSLQHATANNTRRPFKSHSYSFTRTIHTSAPSLSTEYASRCGPDGHPPVVLGEKLNNTYKVISKLGKGVYSTVWLASNLTSSTPHFVALKILRADPFGSAKPTFELDILNDLRQTDSSHRGHAHAVHLLDSFIHQGPHRAHLCLVLPLMGPSIAQLLQSFADRQMPAAAVKRIAEQLLHALDWLHGSCGVIHTDIKPDNLLIEIPNVDRAVEKHLALPEEIEEASQSDHSNLWQSLLKDSVVDLPNINVKVTDFGVASWTSKHLSDWIQPPSLRAPEVFLGAPWDQKVDLWCLACVIYEMLQGRVLFRGRPGPDGTWTAGKDQLAQMIELFGPIPPSLLERGKYSRKYFDDSGAMLHIKHLYPYSLQELFAQSKNPSMSSEDYTHFESFLRDMLQYEPDTRRTPKELLRSPWLSSNGATLDATMSASCSST